MHFRLTRSTVLAALLATLGSTAIFGATIDPSTSLVTSFNTTPNTADMLWFFDNTNLVTTGSPVISFQLFDGVTLLATYSQTGSQVIEVAFDTPSAPFDAPLFVGPPPSMASFSSINNGTIDGRLVMSVMGGSITFNLADIVLKDATTVALDSFTFLPDVTNVAFDFAATALPEPDTSFLIGLGLVACMVLPGMRRRAKRRARDR